MTGPLSVTLNERTLGLPPVPGLADSPRPATMIPAPFNSVADSTLVTSAGSWRPEKEWTAPAKRPLPTPLCH